MMIPIVGISAYAYSGKDSVGKVLTEQKSFTRYAFADKLRDFLYALNPLVSFDGDVCFLQEILNEYSWDYAKKMPEIRRLLQRCGTEAGQGVLWPGIWADATFNHIPAETNRLVFTDCRFSHECDAIKSRGGRIWRVVRPGYGPLKNPEGEVHYSEIALDDWHFDTVLVNDGTLEDLERKVLQLCDLWKW